VASLKWLGPSLRLLPWCMVERHLDSAAKSERGPGWPVGYCLRGAWINILQPQEADVKDASQWQVLLL